MLEERRQYQRLVPSAPLFVSLDDSRCGLMLDLCEGGLAVASLVPRNLDDVVTLAFDLPEGIGHVEAKAKIAWTRDSGHLTGVRFVDLDETSQAQLMEWISSGANLRAAERQEEMETVFVTRSTYAQVDAIPRERWDSETAATVAASVATSPSVKTAEAAFQDSLFEPAALEEGIAEHEMDRGPAAANAVATASMAAETAPRIAEESELAEGRDVPEEGDAADEKLEVAEDTEPSTESLEMSEEPDAAAIAAAARESEVANGADPMMWASDTVEWARPVERRKPVVAGAWAATMTEIDESALPDQVEIEPLSEEPVGEERAGAPKSRHTIELFLAVALLTWALVFLGYQMGSSWASHAARDVASESKAPDAPLVAYSSSVPKTGTAAESVLSEHEIGTEAGPTVGAKPVPAPVRGTPPEKKAAIGNSVAPVATSAASQGKGAQVAGIVLQVGAMKVEGNATSMVRDLRKKKIPAFVYQHGKDKLYRVGVGPYGDATSSAKMKEQLEKNGYQTITAKWIRD